MLNSLTIFLASLGFIAFGYLSLLRLLSKQSFNNVSLKQYWRGVSTAQFFSNLGSSAFFISMPATSLLLFWGWGPAVLWLLIFHILIESLCYLQYSTPSKKNPKHHNSVADFLLRSSNSKLAIAEQGLIQAFFLLSMATVTALLATLIDRQSGLLFALLALIPARSIISHPSQVLPLGIRIIAGLLLLSLGLAFSDQLGFSIYGDWSPLGDTFSWFRFNNPTIIAAVLTIAVFQLERNKGFKKDLSTFAGIIIVLLVIAMQVQLIWSQPILDAPTNTGQVENPLLPSFISLCLFLFAGFAALLIRLLNEEEHEQENAHEHIAKAQQFARLQSGSLIQICFMILLLISIGSALGIGAWKTHFIEWNESLNILDHLNLAISSTLHLISSESSSGSLLYTILLAALCFTGFSFMLNCASQLTLEERDNESALSLLIDSKLLQAAGTFIAAMYFIGNGISINMWLLIGVLAWTLVTHLIMGMALSIESNGGRKSIFIAISFILMVLGCLQVIILSISWILSGQIAYAICTSIILIIAGMLWISSISQLIKSFGKNSNEDLF